MSADSDCVNRRQFITASGAVIVSTAIAGCSEGDSSDEASGDSSGDSNENNESGDGNNDNGGSGLEILEHEFYEDDISAGVKGMVTNGSDSEISYVGVQAEFLDSEGTRIGEGLDNTTDLAAGQDWSFDATMLESETDAVEDYNIEVSDSPF